MKGLILVGLLVAAVLPSAFSQVVPSIGSCDLTDITSFLAELPDATTCTSAVIQLYNPNPLVAPTRDQVNNALDTLCTPDCGQALAQYAAGGCGTPEFAFGILLFCQPAGEPSGNRCRFAFPDYIDDAVFDALASCANINASNPTCDAACNVALQRFGSSAGCCYQGIYTDISAIRDYVDNGILSEFRSRYVKSVIDPFVWSTCDVPRPDLCTGNPFPGTSSLAVGVCTESRVEDFVETLPMSCEESYGKAFESPSTSQEEREEIFKTVCTDGCAGALSNWENENCQSSLESFLPILFCRETTAKLGSRCGVVITPQLRNASFFFSAGACLSYNPVTGTCPSGCQAALTELSAQLGCCYQAFYNDTPTLDYLLINGDLSFQDWGFFRELGRDERWEACDVPLVPMCPVLPLGSGALGFISSSIVLFGSAFLSFFLLSHAE